jgi:hypothetical protein
MVCFAHRSCTPQRRPPTLAQRPFTLAHGALEADSFVARAKHTLVSELTAGLDMFRARSCTHRRRPSDARATGIYPLAHGRWSLSRSSRFAKHKPSHGADFPMVCFAHRSCTPQRRLPPPAQRPFTLAHGALEADSFVARAKHTLVFGADCWSGCVSRIAPALVGGAPPTLAQREGIRWRTGRCVGLLAPLAAMFVNRRRLRRIW